MHFKVVDSATLSSVEMALMKLSVIPFTKESQLCRDLESPTSPVSCLPGQPRVPLRDSVRLFQYLRKEFWAVDLEQIADRLWMMSTQSNANISSLHQQRVKGRMIVITEDPRLHLIWIYDRVFIKPLPRYLLSYGLWKDHLLPGNSSLVGASQEEQQKMLQVQQSILGFLRTYFYLIQHESDFQIACNKDVRLLPPDISWLEFCNVSQQFDRIEDDQVSKRYYYGELRLTRLNLYAKFWLRRFHYEQVHGQYGPFFARFYGPLLFVFGVASIILSALQVELAAETLLTAHRWPSLWFASRWISVITIISMALLTIALSSLLIGMLADEWVFALRTRYKKRRKNRQGRNQA